MMKVRKCGGGKPPRQGHFQSWCRPARMGPCYRPISMEGTYKKTGRIRSEENLAKTRSKEIYSPEEDAWGVPHEDFFSVSFDTKLHERSLFVGKARGLFPPNETLWAPMMDPDFLSSERHAEFLAHASIDPPPPLSKKLQTIPFRDTKVAVHPCDSKLCQACRVSLRNESSSFGLPHVSCGASPTNSSSPPRSYPWVRHWSWDFMAKQSERVQKHACFQQLAACYVCDTPPPDPPATGGGLTSFDERLVNSTMFSGSTDGPPIRSFIVYRSADESHSLLGDKIDELHSLLEASTRRSLFDSQNEDPQSIIQDEECPDGKQELSLEADDKPQYHQPKPPPQLEPNNKPELHSFQYPSDHSFDFDNSLMYSVSDANREKQKEAEDEEDEHSVIWDDLLSFISETTMDSTTPFDGIEDDFDGDERSI